MLMSPEELRDRLCFMSEIGISEKHKQLLIDSANDSEYEDVIRLIDIISSKAMEIAVASGGDIKNAIERHLEARCKLIQKIKELSGKKLEDDDFAMPAL